MWRTIHFHVIMSFLLLKCVRSDFEGFLHSCPLLMNSNNTHTKIACKQLFEEHVEQSYALQTNVEEVPVDETFGKYIVDAKRNTNHIISTHRTTDLILSNTREFGKPRNEQKSPERRMSEQRQLRIVTPRRDRRRTITRNRNQGGHILPTRANQFRLQNDRWVLGSRITSDGRMCVNRLSSIHHARDNSIEYHSTAKNERDLIRRKSMTNGNKSCQLITRHEKRTNDERVSLILSDHSNIDRSTRNDNRRKRERYAYRGSQFRQQERRGRRLESSLRLTFERLQDRQIGRLPSERNDCKNIEKRQIIPYSNEQNILQNTNGYSQRVRQLAERKDNHRDPDSAYNDDRSLDRMARRVVRYYLNVRTRAIRRNSVVRHEKEREEFRIRIQRRRDNSEHKHFQTEEARMKSTDDRVFTHRNEPTNIRTRGRCIRSDDERTHSMHTGERYSVRNRSVFIREHTEKRERRENNRNERFSEETSRIRINRDKSQDSKYRQMKHDNFISVVETERRGQYQYNSRIRSRLLQKRYNHEQDNGVAIVTKREQFRSIKMVDHIADNKQSLSKAPEQKMMRPAIDVS